MFPQTGAHHDQNKFRWLKVISPIQGQCQNASGLTKSSCESYQCNFVLEKIDEPLTKGDLLHVLTIYIYRKCIETVIVDRICRVWSHIYACQNLDFGIHTSLLDLPWKYHQCMHCTVSISTLFPLPSEIGILALSIPFVTYKTHRLRWNSVKKFILYLMVIFYSCLALIQAIILSLIVTNRDHGNTNVLLFYHAAI